LKFTKAQFKKQNHAILWNTRAAGLSKFVIYESPLTVVCDHPDNILNQPGSEFLKIVPTTWDDIKFLDGYPGEFVAIAKRSAKEWFAGIMNNSKEKEVTIKFDFIPEGSYTIEIWADAKEANSEPKNIRFTTQNIKSGEALKVKLANNGGWEARIK